MLLQVCLVEFDFDNALLAVQTHDSGGETVLSILQDYLSPNELACLGDSTFTYSLDEAPFWHLCSDTYSIVHYCSINRLRHKHSPL